MTLKLFFSQSHCLKISILIFPPEKKSLETSCGRHWVLVFMTFNNRWFYLSFFSPETIFQKTEKVNDLKYCILQTTEFTKLIQKLHELIGMNLDLMKACETAVGFPVWIQCFRPEFINRGLTWLLIKSALAFLSPNKISFHIRTIFLYIL